MFWDGRAVCGWAIAWSSVVSFAPSLSTMDWAISQPRGKLISRPRGVTAVSNARHKGGHVTMIPQI
jgi:hypothetical protein